MESRLIVILTGAGISKETGFHTCALPFCLWARVRIEDVATPAAFARDPDRVHAFYNHRREALVAEHVAPNAAHLALARLEAEWPGEVLLVTQNVDDLHERAGSANLIHMHGELLKARCLVCGGVSRWREAMTRDSLCPACGAEGMLRVHVVWFGEMPLEMERIYEALARSEEHTSELQSLMRIPYAVFCL